MREEEIGREGLITYTNLLQLVCRLQGSAYDNYGEIEQVKKQVYPFTCRSHLLLGISVFRY